MSNKLNYFFDTEFIEGKQAKTCLNVKVGETKPTIDLISIGIVCEDGREYYAVSKDFNLKDAWERYDLKIVGKKDTGMTPIYENVYWIRENVLRPIFEEFYKDFNVSGNDFTFVNMQKVINVIGKPNKQIAEEVKDFVLRKDTNPIFYAYYADYDWVVFCWLFGKMNDLPKGFPYYCRDLKQIADDIWETTGKDTRFEKGKNEHNALEDAKWNFEFYKFLMEKKNEKI
jgi:hypothetical protein